MLQDQLPVELEQVFFNILMVGHKINLQPVQNKWQCLKRLLECKTKIINKEMKNGRFEKYNYI